MNTFSLFRSQTFWAVLGICVVQVGSTVLPFIPSPWASIISIVLGVIAANDHYKVATAAGAVN